jgi:hypothetical protein
MKLIKSLVVAMAAFAGLATSSHAALALNFSSTVGSTIQFNGTNSTFQFNPSTSPLFGGIFFGSQWQIGSESGGTSSAMQLLGSFNNGPFHYGTITTNISGANIDESAVVTGPLAALLVTDGSGSLSGNLDWVQIMTHDNAGTINATLAVNVTGLVYTGTNPDLAALAANGPGALDLTFQFSPGMTLGDLTTGAGPYQTSYSGSLSVPEPTSLGCFLLGAGMLVCYLRLKQSQRKMQPSPVSNRQQVKTN